MLSKICLLLLALMCACISMTIAIPSASFRGDGVMMPAAGIHQAKRAVAPHPAAAAAPGKDEEEPDKDPEAAEMKIIPNDKAKVHLRTMVESFVSLVDELRQHGAVRLPDPMERVCKSMSEEMDTLQDYLNEDLNIDLGNILNSGGK